MKLAEKFYKTYKERIEILTDRNMTINKRSSIHRKVISDYNYYNVINAYKDLFLEKNKQSEQYINGTTPDQLLAIYKFDEALRIILLRYLLKIEEKVKHCITQSFFSHVLNDENLNESEKRSLHKDSTYINIKYYDTSNTDKKETFAKFQEIAYKQINTQYKKDNSSIKKYKDEHGYIPMWVLFNVLMFGNISKYFTILNRDIKIRVMKLMGIKWNFQVEEETIQQFESTLEILTLARNVCAHNERLYCFKHNIPLKDRYLSFNKALPAWGDDDFNEKSKMKFSIFSVIFLIGKFVEMKENQTMLKEIDKEVLKLEKKLSTIDIYEVLTYMKMPNDWKDKLS